MFYWVTVLFSQTLGTALGDWTADTADLGYRGGAMVFSAMLAILAVAHYRTALSRTTLFWAAFILTRPLGAVVGDFLDKPVKPGRLGVEPLLRLGGAARAHGVVHPDLFAESGKTRALSAKKYRRA